MANEKVQMRVLADTERSAFFDFELTNQFVQVNAVQHSKPKREGAMAREDWAKEVTMKFPFASCFAASRLRGLSTPLE